MTVATSDSAQTHTGTVAHLVRTAPRRLRLDPIGASALVVAVGGLGASIIVLRSLQVERPVDPSLSSAAVPIRDQWYLERQAMQTAISPASTTSVAKDRWYLDAARPSIGSASNVPPLRDQWYLDQGGVTQPRSLTPTGIEVLPQ